MSAPTQSTYFAPGQWERAELPARLGDPIVCGFQISATRGRCTRLPIPAFLYGLRAFDFVRRSRGIFSFRSWRLIDLTVPPRMTIAKRRQACRKDWGEWLIPFVVPSAL